MSDIEQSAFEEDTTHPMVKVIDLKNHAKRVMSKQTWSYLEGAAGTGQTMLENEAAFSRYRLLPHMLRDVAGANTTTTILGHVVSCPIGISPSGQQRLATPDGEIATVRAAGAKNVISAFSTYSGVKMEDIGAASPGGVKWQQIILFRDQGDTLNLVRRAEQSGFSALVLTSNQLINPDIPYPNFPGGVYKSTSNLAQNWEDLIWLRKQTRLPIIVKGILRGDEAKLAVNSGVDAIWVSNNGGRVLDGVPATIDVLSEVVAAVNGSVKVYMDGGIRTGTDVAKALALGARAVFIGRPIWYGLAHSGQEGVEKILDILQTEFLNTMQLLGANRPEMLDPSVVKTPTS